MIIKIEEQREENIQNMCVKNKLNVKCDKYFENGNNDTYLQSGNNYSIIAFY